MELHAKYKSEIQIYFHTYKFYNDDIKRKYRTKQVNHLLTETDKQNLEIINKAISELSQEK